MSVKKYIATKDNTISTAFKFNLSDRASLANMGSSDILEIYSIYGQASSSSVEQTRILIQFPVDKILSDRNADIIPASGSTSFILKLYNAAHTQTVPEKYTISTIPLVKAWDEGSGLDMESFLDLGASNWLSSSKSVLWAHEGSDYARETIINTSSVGVAALSSVPFKPFERTQYFDIGTGHMEVDITSHVEEWLKVQKTPDSRHATASITFDQNIASGSLIKIYNYNSDYRVYAFSTASAVVGKTVFVKVGANSGSSLTNLRTSLNTNSAVNAEFIHANAKTLHVVQKIPGWPGNILVSSSLAAQAAGSIEGFLTGSGLKDYGLLVKLSGSYELGSTTSYYTKKFFARGSQYVLKRPAIEARWDDSIKDERYNFHTSKIYYPDDVNNNNIYLYNKIGGKLQDFPASRTPKWIRIYEQLGSNPIRLADVSAVAARSASVGKVRTGVYSASLSYTGSKTSVYDVWDLTNDTYITGSGLTIIDTAEHSSFHIPEYTVNITNLKPTYNKEEKATLRVYTRNKNWQPNVYTVASKAAPVNNIKNMFYKLRRVADNFRVIDYSTGSTPSYSTVSYDANGSFLDLDMSILEQNYLYEISFLYKDGPDYVEIKDKFKFRVD